MSSQKQCHRMRKIHEEQKAYWRLLRDENNALRKKVEYLERRPPIWRLVSLWRWKKEGTV